MLSLYSRIINAATAQLGSPGKPAAGGMTKGLTTPAGQTPLLSQGFQHKQIRDQGPCATCIHSVAVLCWCLVFSTIGPKSYSAGLISTHWSQATASSLTVTKGRASYYQTRKGEHIFMTAIRVSQQVSACQTSPQ